MLFDLQTESDGKSTLVTLRGDFDVQVAQHVAERLTEIEARDRNCSSWISTAWASSTPAEWA